MPWRSINQTHAIERVRFTMEFKQSVPEKLAGTMSDVLTRLSRDTRLNGPTPSQAVQIGVRLDPKGRPVLVPPPHRAPHWQFKRETNDGKTLEVVGVEDDKIVYEATSYNRWRMFRQRFEKAVLPIVELGAQSLDVDKVTLEFQDRFIFEGPRGEAAPKDLLVGFDSVLHPDARSGRSMWHLHRGWFEGTPNGDLLINQNFDAIDVVGADANEPLRSISVLTKAEARTANYRVDAVPLMQMLDFFHQVTKAYFSEAVHSSMHNQIGLGS